MFTAADADGCVKCNDLPCGKATGTHRFGQKFVGLLAGLRAVYRVVPIVGNRIFQPATEGVANQRVGEGRNRAAVRDEALADDVYAKTGDALQRRGQHDEAFLTAHSGIAVLDLFREWVHRIQG